MGFSKDHIYHCVQSLAESGMWTNFSRRSVVRAMEQLSDHSIETFESWQGYDWNSRCIWNCNQFRVTSNHVGYHVQFMDKNGQNDEMDSISSGGRNIGGKMEGIYLENDNVVIFSLL